jgi:hemoglobin
VDESLFDQVGETFFFRLVDAFYEAVESSELLRPMYPIDLNPSRRHLALFLIQYWGGPRTYGDERGHPRLRLRHAPFPITRDARDAWLEAMSSALASRRNELNDDQFEALDSYFRMVAEQLRNV